MANSGTMSHEPRSKQYLKVGGKYVDHFELSPNFGQVCQTIYLRCISYSARLFEMHYLNWSTGSPGLRISRTPALLDFHRWPIAPTAMAIHQRFRACTFVVFKFLGNDCIDLSSWCFESLITQQARINILFDSIVGGRTFQATRNE